MSFDDNNVFAKILRGEIPCKKIYEDEFVLSFYDINPQKKFMPWLFQKVSTLISMISALKPLLMKW